MLERIIIEGHKQKIPVSVCGEVAGDPVFAPLLLGLGVDCLSMAPSWIPSVKYIVRAMTMADAKTLAAESLKMSSPREIYAKCEAFYRSRVKMD